MSTQEALELAGMLAVLWTAGRALRAAPLAALTAVALAALAIQSGVVSLPRPALAARVDAGARALGTWQGRQAARVSCSVAATAALRSGEEAALDALERRCNP